MTTININQAKDLVHTPNIAKELAEDFLDHAPDYKDSNPSYICPICGNGTGTQGTGIKFTPDTGSLYCFGGCNAPHDLIDLVGAKNSLDSTKDFKKILSILLEPKGYQIKEKRKTKRVNLDKYNYINPQSNKVIFFKQRYKEVDLDTGEIVKPKAFYGWDPVNNCSPSKILSIKEQRLIYNAIEIEKAKKNSSVVYFVEGEKDVDTLKSLGIYATTIYQTSQGLKPEHLEQLQGIKKLVFIPDNDKHGTEFILQAFDLAKTRVKNTLVTHWSKKTPIGYDITDFIEDLSDDKDKVSEFAKFVESHKLNNLDDFKDKIKENLPKEELDELFKKEKSSTKENIEDNKIYKNGILLNDFLIFNKNGTIKKPHDYNIKEHIKNNFSILTLGSTPYVYSNGLYSDIVHLEPENYNGKTIDGTSFINKEIEKLIPDEYITKKTRSDIRDLILEDTKLGEKEISSTMNRYPDHYINFSNGMYNIATGKLEEHNQDYFSFNQVPHNIDINEVNNATLEDCPIFKNTLKEMFLDDENFKMFLDYLSTCLIKAKTQQFLIIAGAGGTGKSMILNLIRKIIGKDNTSNVSLQDLTDKFKPIELFGKQVNIYAELPKKSIDQGDIIKIVFGGDLLTAQRKFQEPFFFTSYAKAIFSANRIPKYHDDRGNAFYRRMLIIRVRQKAEYIENIEEKLEKEIPQIINYLVRHLSSIYSNNIIVEESESSKREKAILQGNSDSVVAFINDCIGNKKNDTVNIKIKRSLVYEYYKIYCRSFDRKPLGKTSFYQELEENGIKFYKNQTWLLDKSLTLTKFDDFDIAELIDTHNINMKYLNRFFEDLKEIFKNNKEI